MNTLTKILPKCLCCGSTLLMDCVDLGRQVPCNWLREPGSEPLQAFPLETRICSFCSHMQLRETVEPATLFSNYTYRTGVSFTLCQHYKDLAESAINFHRLSNYSNTHWRRNELVVMDIGCNDCTLLSYFGQNGLKTVGVDPCEVSDHKPVDMFVESPWNEDVMGRLMNDKIRPDIITATNVLAHNSYPQNFLSMCNMALHNDGIIVIEFPYAKDMMKNCEFDTIYHEHVSYFSVKSFTSMLVGTGLYVAEVEQHLIHGGSLRFILRKTERFVESQQHCMNLRSLLEIEEAAGLHDMGTYAKFGELVKQRATELQFEMNLLISNGYTPIGFGASGKGAVMLNYTGIKLEYIIDETPCKQGKLSAGRDIPIFPLERLHDEPRPLAVVIMAWNCFEECRLKLSHNVRNAKTELVSYVPLVNTSPLFN